ncbi:MAG: tetratricopeptide repeat protein, partial [Planctomycetota bacterium]
FSDAIEIVDANDQAHVGFAETLWHRGEHRQAIEQMERALQISGDDPSISQRLGRMYLEMNWLAEAQVQCDIALKGNRNSADAWALRGDCFAAADQTRQALAAYHRALALRPDSPEIQLAAAEVYQRQGRFDRSLATLDHLRDAMPADGEPPKSHLMRGIALQSLGRPGEARTSFVMARETMPDSTLPLEALVRLEITEKRFAVAQSLLDELDVRAPMTPGTMSLHQELAIHRDGTSVIRR